MRNDYNMINTQDNWPRWPVLPLKSTNGNESGLIYVGELSKVYLVNMFALGERPGKTYDEKFVGVEIKQYDSINDLLKEWRVD